MTDFETAARKAGEEIIDVIDNDKPGCFHEIITKHHADLAETFGLLCELAKFIPWLVKVKEQAEHCGLSFALHPRTKQTQHEMAKLQDAILRVSNCSLEMKLYRFEELLANPRIAALLAEKG